jgi:serine/threonine protein kinase
MGVVYRATNVVTEKRVAIKWLLHDSDDRNARERFVREARAAARIPHPNVVDVYDVVEHEGSMFLVMEYLVGEPLSAILARGNLPINELLGLLLPAMRAVAVAHVRGVIHRDLKPENLFLCRQEDGSEHLKVLDFGISKVLASSAEKEESLTRSGSAVGTPRYMPVEQLSGDKDVDGRVDVYAFGVILYQALTGQLPFDGDSYGAIAIRVATYTPPLPRKVRPDIPPLLERAVLGAMARDRAARFATMDDLVKALEGALDPASDVNGTLSATRPALPSLVASTPAKSLPAREVAPPRSIRARLWAAAAIAVLGLLGWYGLSERRGSTDSAAERTTVNPESSAVADFPASAAPPAPRALVPAPVPPPVAVEAVSAAEPAPAADVAKPERARRAKPRMNTLQGESSKVSVPPAIEQPVAAPAPVSGGSARDEKSAAPRSSEPASVHHRAGELDKAHF